MSVPCDLGGRVYGHLEFVLAAVEYVNIIPTAYVCPIHPGILQFAVGTPNHKSARLAEEHKEFVRLNRESNNVEKFLLKQISKTLPDIYLKNLLKRIFKHIHR